MPDSYNNVWIDSSFSSAYSSNKDATVDLSFSEANIVGGYSIPVIYQAGEFGDHVFQNHVIEYLQHFSTISGIVNIPVYYFKQNSSQLIDGIIPALIFYNTGDTTISGLIGFYTYYSTGFTAISGSFNNLTTFVSGHSYNESYDSSVSMWIYPQLSGVSNFITNYTNFSGNLTTSGTPIPVTILDSDCITSYFMGTMNANGSLNKIVDISFAGWVDHHTFFDVYSALHCVGSGHTIDLTVISGSVLSNCLDAYCSTLTTSGINIDVVCSLLDYIGINCDVDLILGRVGYNKTDIFSTVLDSKGITCDIELYSLKITNFSIDEGQYTNIFNSISVDVVDDVCSVSIDNTYFIVDGVVVSGTLVSITDGYRLTYPSVEDFEFLNGPTTFTIHAENNCGKVIEQDFNLTFGYVVEYENSESVGIDCGFDKKVVVRVVAENMASCPVLNSVAYTLESSELRNRDLGASITGLFYADDHKDISASVYPQSTAYFYGKEFKVVVYAKDFAGNSMAPFEIAYRIENKPAD